MSDHVQLRWKINMHRLFAVVFVAAFVAQPAASEDSMERWQDAQGRLSFSYPAAWTVREVPTEPDILRVIAFTGLEECQFWSIERPSSAGAPTDAVRQRYSRVMTAEQWRTIVEPLDYFRDGLEIGEPRVETAGTWPVQRVDFRGGERQVRGAIQGRPGRELMSLCVSYDGQDRSAQFALVEESVDATAR